MVEGPTSPLRERSTRSMRSTASVWTDANDTWSRPVSRAEAREEIREALLAEEQASQYADLAHKSKLSQRSRLQCNVDMVRMQSERVPFAKPRKGADLTYDPSRGYALLRPNTSAGPPFNRGAQAVSGGCVLDTPEKGVYASLGLRGRAKRVARPTTAPSQPLSIDLPVPSLHMLSTKRRPVTPVSMATMRTRPSMVLKALSDACYEPRYSLTDRRSRSMGLHVRAPPRFGTTPTGSVNAFWLTNTGIVAINGVRNGITPAIIRPACSPIKRWRR